MVKELDVQVHTSNLHTARLSSWETFGQSLASVAPTASPAMVVPLVLAVSGKASWLAYVLATIGIACIAAQINRFALKTTSPGSLYSFVHESLGRWPSLITGWALLVAYVGTAAAVTGGFTSYAFSLSGKNGLPPSLVAAALTAIAALLAGLLAYRDVQLSARLMLWFEILSILVILVLFFFPGPRSALHFDTNQFHLGLDDLRKVRGGLVLAIFSFVGFESAAALGSESVNPARNIPRAVRLTALGSGLFFVITAYAEYTGFGSSVATLQDSTAPLQLLAHLRGLPLLAPLLAIGSVVSFFACTLACITAGARTAFGMSRDGYLPFALGRAHMDNRTPHVAVVLITLSVALPAIVLSARGVSPFDVYGWVGTVATFGFITAYFFVTLSALIRTVRERSLTPLALVSSVGALVVLAIAAWSAFDLSAPAPELWFPYIYLGLLLIGMGVSAISIWRRPPPSTVR